METNLKIDMKPVGELMSAITRQTITEGRFRFDMPAQSALNLLAAFYADEVKRRAGVPSFDVNTSANLAQLAEYITAENPKFGILLCGSCGNGKTTMMRAFFRAVSWLDEDHHFQFLDDSETGRRFRPETKIFDIRDIVNAAKDFNEFKSVRSLRTMGIDDLGKEPSEVLNYGSVINPAIELLEYRYNRQLFTFITTNLTKSEIRSKYGARIADRFNEMLHVIVFQDISYRK